MFGLRIKQLRENLDLSVAKLAKQLNMSASTLTSYEREERTPSIEFLSLLYKTLNVNPIWFLTGEGEMFITKLPPLSAVKNELRTEVLKILKEEGVID